MLSKEDIRRLRERLERGDHKERRVGSGFSFCLSVMAFLDALPHRERSRWIELAILERAERQAMPADTEALCRFTRMLEGA